MNHLGNTQILIHMKLRLEMGSNHILHQRKIHLVSNFESLDIAFHSSLSIVQKQGMEEAKALEQRELLEVKVAKKELSCWHG